MPPPLVFFGLLWSPFCLGQLRLQGGDLPAALAHFADARAHSRSFPELHDALACELVATAHQKAIARLAV